jgi:hypothetical protein
VPGLLYLGTASGVFRSVDAGSSWTEVSSGLPCGGSAATCPSIAALVVDQVRPGAVWAATRAGIFASSDYGDHWANVSLGLPNLDVRSLAIANNGFTLLAGTFGDGVFAMDLPGPHVRRRIARSN